MKVDTQFSIYKIDQNKILKSKDINSVKKANEVRERLLAEIKELISKKPCSTQRDICMDGFYGVVYQTINIPDWNGMIEALITGTDRTLSFELENINVSYILLYQYNDSIYAMTAGYGNHIIKDYIERNWGLYLMPKILGDDEGVIREIKENNLYGNELSYSKANRYTTNIIHEKKMRAVIKELSLEVDENVAEMFGIDKKSKGKKTCIMLKDSLNLRKSIELSKLKEVLPAIYEIEKKEDAYAIGYFVNARREGIKNSSLIDMLIGCILNNNIGNFVMIGDDYQRYYTCSDEYIITDEQGVECYTSDTPITIAEIVDYISEDKKLSKTYVDKVLKKWKIQTKDNSGNIVMNQIPIFKALEGFVEYGEEKIPCFLMEGEWYCMISQYTSILDDEFQSRLNQNIKCVNEIKKKYNLKSDGKTENDYNDSFFGADNVIVAHKSLIDKFEIADLIFWDDKSLYLMCNKSKFDASGSRDLTNQIWASANYLQVKLNSRDRKAFLSDYFLQIQNRYSSKNRNLNIEEKEFVELFDRQIVFVAGYMSGYSLGSRSYYAKYLDIDNSKKIADMGYQYLTMNIETDI